MTRTARLLTLLAATAAASAQTPAIHKATHHTTAAKTAAKPVENPADNPPGVPKVAGTPKNLYALRYIDTFIGTGEPAQPRKYYTVHYTGYLTDGTKFDSSVDRGTPITFPYGAHQVIPGWDTGFQDMHVGGKRRLFVPYQLAYGESGRPPVIPAKADLIFDVELVGMSDTPPGPPIPAHPPTAPASQPANTPPSDATRTSPPHPER